MFLYFKGLSRLSDFLALKDSSSISDLYIRFSIYNGTRQFDSVIVKVDNYDKLTQKKVDFFTTDSKIVFNHADLCLLPREAFLVVQLCTINSGGQTSNTHSGNGYSSLASDENNSYRCLAWTSKSLFDDNL